MVCLAGGCINSTVNIGWRSGQSDSGAVDNTVTQGADVTIPVP